MEDEDDLVYGWKGIAATLGYSSKNTAKRRAEEDGLPVKKQGSRYLASKRELLEWKIEYDKKQKARSARSRKSWKQLRFLALALLVLVVLVLIVVLLRWLRPVEIAEVVIDSFSISALSQAGKVLWVVSLPEIEVESYVEGTHYFLTDVNGDGLQELLFAVRPKRMLEANSWLLCIDGKGKELWRFDYGHELRVGDRHFPQNFEGVNVFWLEANGQSYILTFGYHRPFYPTQVALLDPSSGEVVGEYLHQGQLEDFAVVDVDSDPEMEILLGGVNNPGLGAGRPILAVLDLPFPAVAKSFFGQPSAKEVSYLVFPEVDAVSGQSGMSVTRRVVVQQDGRLLVGVGMDRSSLLLHYFDSDLELQEVRPSDGLVREHERLFRLGVLDHRFDAERELAEWSVIQRFDKAPNANTLDATKE